MGTKLRQAGFSALEGIVIVVIVGLLGAVGFWVYNQQKGKRAESQAASETAVPAAPAVKNASDLTTAESALDSSNLNTTADDSKLQSEASNF